MKQVIAPLLVVIMYTVVVFYTGFHLGEYKIKHECPVCVAIAPKY